MRRAFTLVEVVLAFAVLALSIVPLFTLLSSSGRQGRQTGDHGLALAVLQKSAEELRLASWENPYLARTLLQNADPGLSRAVVDGDSPLFPVLEDLREPFGLMQKGVDPAITGEFVALYRDLSTHRLGFSAAAAQLTSGTATDLELGLSWTGFRGVTDELSLSVRLPERRPTPRALPTPDREQADELVRTLLFPDRGGPLAAAAGSADLPTVRALGDAALLSMGFTEAEDVYRAQLAAAETARARSDDPVIVAYGQLALARTHERRAAQALGVAACLAAPLAVLAKPGARARLSATPPDPRRYRLALVSLRGLAGAFQGALMQARDAYAAACAPPYSAALSSRTRMRVVLKLVEVLKLGALTAAPEDLPVLQGLLDRVRQEQAGRNPSYADLAAEERERCFDLATLAATYPGDAPARLNELRERAPGVLTDLLPRLP